ncbi:hypothetical protein ACLKMH_23695 [Psychromonas sp. KJ10-10]
MNNKERHIAFIPAKNDKTQEDMSSIDIHSVMQNLSSFLNSHEF